MKTMTESFAGAFVCSMRKGFNLRHNVQLYHFGRWKLMSKR